MVVGEETANGGTMTAKPAAGRWITPPNSPIVRVTTTSSASGVRRRRTSTSWPSVSSADTPENSGYGAGEVGVSPHATAKTEAVTIRVRNALLGRDMRVAPWRGGGVLLHASEQERRRPGVRISRIEPLGKRG